MTTRANVYIGTDFVGEIMTSAYPVRQTDDFYSSSLWAVMERLDSERATQKEFETATVAFINWEQGGEATDYLGQHYGGTSNGVGNWSYEYMWVPFEAPASYTDWDSWRGRIMVRTIDHDLTWKRFGSSYVQIPGPWVPLCDWWIWAEEDQEQDA